MYSRSNGATTLPQRNAVAQVAANALAVQWANGKSDARRQGEQRFTSHIGFYAQVGKDSAFDAWMTALGVHQLYIRHPRAGQAPEVVLHWDIGEDIQFYPLTAGPVASTVAASVSARYRQATAEAGIGLRWGAESKSKLALRGYLGAHGAIYYAAPLQLVARGIMTERLLAALVRHVQVCQAADEVRREEAWQAAGGSREPVGLWELALPLGAGQEEDWGRGKTTTVVPFVGKHPAQISAEYLASIYRPNELAQAAARDWPGVQTWALEYTFHQADDQAPADANGGSQGE